MNLKVVNTSGWPVECKYNGRDIYFGPFEEKEIWDVDCVLHLTNSNSYRGIVDLFYSDSMQAKYPNYEDFVFARKKEGLGKLLAWVKECRVGEMQALRDINIKGNSSGELEGIDVKKFDYRISKVQSWIEALDKKEETGEDIVKRRGRPRQNGFTDNQDQGQAQA